MDLKFAQLLSVVMCILIMVLASATQASQWLEGHYGKLEAKTLKETGLAGKYASDRQSLDNWERIFRGLRDADDGEVSRAVESLVRDLLLVIDTDLNYAKSILQGMHSLRHVMPDEIRWAVAALEIQAGIVNKSTLVDLRSAAIRSTFGRESEDFISSLIIPKSVRRFAIACPPLKGESRVRDEIRFYDLGVGAFLMSNWHLISALDPQNTNIEIERKRLEWIAEVSENTASFSSSQMERVLRTLNHPNLVSFTSEDRRVVFLEYVLEIAKKLSHRYGSYSVNETGDMVYKKTAFGKSGYGKVREIIGSWLFTDIKFILKNLPRLQREGFFEFGQIFERQLAEGDFDLVKDLVLKRKLSAESYISAALMLLSQNDKGSNSLSSADRTEINDSLIEIFTTAQEKSGLVGVSGRGLESVRTENKFFYSALEWFYNFSIDTKSLNNSHGRTLFNNKIVRTSYLNEETFQKLEVLRLKLVSDSMDYDSYRSEMARHLAKGTNETAAEQMRIAQRLGQVLQEKDKATAGQTIRDRYTEKSKWGLFGSKVNWEAERGWPVHLMIKVNPNDVDMQQHLIDVIVEQRVDSAISVGDALAYLTETKTTSPKIKNFIIRHLRFPEAGDSVSYFLALIRLYPESTADILGIVYRFRSDVAKLVPMMKVLLDEVIKNPSLLAGLKSEIQKDSGRSEAGKVYAGSNLADWLTIQVDKHKKTSCSKFYSGR